MDVILQSMKSMEVLGFMKFCIAGFHNLPVSFDTNASLFLTAFKHVQPDQLRMFIMGLPLHWKISYSHAHDIKAKHSVTIKRKLC